MATAEQQMQSYFECHLFDMAGFQKPGDKPRITNPEEEGDWLDYVTEYSLLPKTPLVFRAGPVRGIGPYEYCVVEVNRSSTYLFLMRMIAPDDEQEFQGRGSYKWRVCGYAQEWPDHHSKVTWTHA